MSPWAASRDWALQVMADCNIPRQDSHEAADCSIEIYLRKTQKEAQK